MCNTEILDKVLYSKSYICPLCGAAFKTKAIHIEKNELTSIDDDLYAHYLLVNPLFYSIIVCPCCGYSAHIKTIGSLLPKQKEWLNEHFNQYKPRIQYSEYPTTTEAILKHKMALVASITKKGHISEQAYIALNIAWLYRDLGDTENENLFLTRAYEGLSEAFSKEEFPILDMDEPTLTYTLSALAYKLNYLEDSKRLLSNILTSIDCPPYIKEYALTLKNKVLV